LLSFVTRLDEPDRLVELLSSVFPDTRASVASLIDQRLVALNREAKTLTDKLMRKIRGERASS
jgi:hypothetical protein